MMSGKPFDDGPHKLEQFWNNFMDFEEERRIQTAKGCVLLNEFLATKVMGWEIRDDNPGAWYDPESGFYLFAVGQSSKFNENWHPTYDIEQAMHVFRKLNLSAEMSFYPDVDDEEYQWTVEIRCDHSIGTGKTLEMAIATACGNYKRIRYTKP